MAAMWLFLLLKWSFTICPMPYNLIQNVLSVSLNKTLLTSPEKLNEEVKRDIYIN